jgi:hypothetical protein
MNPLHESKPEDVTSLQMENNLLAHEVKLLRGRLRSVTRQLRDMQAADEDGTPAGLAQMRQAYDDIHHLVERLNSSGLGPLLRRRAGFRTLLERYTRKEG